MSQVSTIAASDSGAAFFLTAYDPSDLPGASIDPLGFERGYLFLADKILPGLTNVAEWPRYFSVICAGAHLAEVGNNDTPRSQYQHRLQCIQRFERLWALANVLASQAPAVRELPPNSIRGVTYAKGKVETLIRERARRVDADFKLLSRQVPYGVVGIYGAVADRMRLLDRKTFALTAGLGERLAEGFLEATDTPNTLIKAVREGRDLSISALTEWGERSHIDGEPYSVETTCLHEALYRDPVRSKMAKALAAYPFNGPDDTELKRLERLLPALQRDGDCLHLAEAVSTILAYEACYQVSMLGFERLLWLCRRPGAVDFDELNADPVFQFVCSRLPAANRKLAQILDSAHSEEFKLDLHRLEDTRRFLERASANCSSPASAAREMLARHEDVQRGKFDRGRRKMPWLEAVGNRISLTMTRVGGLNKEVTKPSEIGPHPYRLFSADALIAAAGGTR